MNHLFIGLGGTGGKVLAALRRQIFQHYRTVEPGNLSIDYLYIDTSANDTKIANITAQIEAGDRVWRTLGHSVQLSPGQIVHLEQADFAGILGNLDDFPTIKRWIGDKSIWDDIWNSAPNGIEAGGQLRRFGRLLFAQNVNKVVTALKNRLVARQSADGIADSKWTIHVIAGLAGGTGSGTFLDLLGQLRTVAAGREAKIVLYAVLPETQDTSWAKENYYANGYAALSELNALIVKRLRLANVAQGSGDYQSTIPVDNCFIVTNRNQNGLIVDMDKVLPEIMAETLYQTVVASGDAQKSTGSRNKTDSLGEDQAEVVAAPGANDRIWRDMVTGENYFGNYEKDGGTGPDARANRFMTFGIKRISIPHQEIREYATMVFLRQYLLRALNNNWVEGLGFDEVAKPFDAAALVRNEAKREAWNLTDKHLRFERNMLGNDPKDLKSIADEFTAALNAKTEAIISEGGKTDGWARELQTFAQSFYEQVNGFRRVGVDEFYRVAERSITERARFVVHDKIAQDLFNEWTAGTRSIRDTVKIVGELIEDVTERIAGSDAKIAEFSRQAEAKDAAVKKLFGEYVNSNPLNPFVNRKKMLQQLSIALAESGAVRASRVAQDYMKRLLSKILTELQALNASTETVAGRIEAASNQAEARRSTRMRANEGNAQSHQWKFYSPDQARQVMGRLQADTELQNQQTTNLAGQLKDLLGNGASFSKFAQNMPVGRIMEALESHAETSAENALKALEDRRERILEASIVQKLYEEFAGRGEDLRRFMSERANEAGSFAAFSSREQLAQGGAPVNRCLVAFIPAEDEVGDQLKAFHAELKAAIKQAGAHVAISETRGRAHAIVFLSLVNQFPLRFLSSLEFLQEKHDALVEGAKAARKRLELYVEGDGRTLPQLYPPSTEQVRKDVAPYWLLAECAGLLKESRNSTTGVAEVRLMTTDEDGMYVSTVVGDVLANGPKSLSPADALQLQQVVTAHLASVVHIDDKNALKKALIDRKNAAMEKAGFDPNHPTVLALDAPVRQARELLGV